MYDIEAIKEQTDLVALVEERVSLRKSGTAYLGMCPLHENHRTPALAVWSATGTWKCFGCGKGGDAIAWMMEVLGMDFKQAVEELGKRLNMAPMEGRTACAPTVRMPAPVPEGPSEVWSYRAMAFVDYCREMLHREKADVVRAYLKDDRGLWEDTWEEFKLGYNPTTIYDDPVNWGMYPPENGGKVWLPRGIVIPGMRRIGTPWYIKIRRPRPSDTLAQYIGALRPRECISEAGRLNPDNDPKFGGPRGGTTTMFRHAGRTSSAACILTEGEWDTMIAWQYGSDLADFATLGGASKHVNAYDLAHLARYAQIGVVMDADEAGDKARERWSQMEGMENRLTVIQPPDHDLTDYWRNGGNLRKWLAGEAAKLLRKAVVGAGEDTPIGWQKSLEWAEMEAMGPSF